MGLTVAQKILKSHLLEGDLLTSENIGIKIDQTLTQDATGTMAYLEFEAMGIPRVKTELSVAYIDHNTLQSGFENADDHEYIRTVAKKIGVRYSRPGNGICHQVHLERFACPGKTLIGSDSHTPTAGGIGSIAFGAGGLDVAVAMGGGTYYILNPKIVGIKLFGKLSTGVSAKDVILEVLKKLTVKGGVGKIIEYFGEGVKTLSVPERATITNMGTELGATTSIFPSDETTLDFLKKQQREQSFVEIIADSDAQYSEIIEIDLSGIVPLAACPHMPDIIKPISELSGIKVDQVCIGSCTNSSLSDMTKAAMILKGKKIAETVSLVISPGSRQVLDMMSENGSLSMFLDAGARLLECTCGPCIGMGQSPKSGAVSLRTFNRNFLGRSGTADADVYLVSPETAAVSALTGIITDPRDQFKSVEYSLPEMFKINDSMVHLPADEQQSKQVEVLRGPNIKEIPQSIKITGDIQSPVSIKVENNITTDHIMPAGAKILPYRSNIPHLSTFCFTVCDTEFPKRAGEMKQSIVVGGENYGQGSSREHAALVPLYLGVRAVIVKSFARIHKDNLVNAGILPLEFINPDDYDDISLCDELTIKDAKSTLEQGKDFVLINNNNGKNIPLKTSLSERQRKILLAGGLLDYTREQQK